ncbi:ABC transporter permease [Rhodoplanes sp. TEM]|uniref:ABC transporter permease n=1 Tax=Rhodoplanes tepidamans TaxID=200616 RepID=A0ABT5JDV6_RHOTP|nr:MULTISPECIES: ABC transporter permease [Rhodoplanes]MDC7787843.1 ABC transporter permease [Rhodoplanes tepidamans]MDC7984487.1 ABC transporter permease [Rhodoplanes sp. TEM]MDQ0357895.1 putative ABC transport system permease protein [Rhodoplanes tepidamans]
MRPGWIERIDMRLRTAAGPALRSGAASALSRLGDAADALHEHLARARKRGLPLIVLLAWRNLFHDRVRLVTTVIGIVFSVILVTVQIGLYLGFERMVTTMIDHADADLWIVPKGTRNFEDPSLLDDRQRFRALSIAGVADVAPLVLGFAEWRRPDGGATPVFVVGSDPRGGGLGPWNVVEGRVDALATPFSVAVDRSYFGRLGVRGLGDAGELRDQKARIVAVTSGIRSFTTTPYVFAAYDRARAYMNTPADRATYFLVRLRPDADATAVRDRIQGNIADAEVLTRAEFRERSRSFWLFGTGAGAALFGGALLGIVVGTVIVAQTLYSSTKDHIAEFATLRAIGSSTRYIVEVILWQALLSAVVGFLLATAAGVVIVVLTADSALPVVMTPGLVLGLLVLTVVMCAVSAVAAIREVVRIDPATVLSR